RTLAIAGEQRVLVVTAVDDRVAKRIGRTLSPAAGAGDVGIVAVVRKRAISGAALLVALDDQLAHGADVARDPGRDLVAAGGFGGGQRKGGGRKEGSGQKQKNGEDEEPTMTHGTVPPEFSSRLGSGAAPRPLPSKKKTRFYGSLRYLHHSQQVGVRKL